MKSTAGSATRFLLVLSCCAGWVLAAPAPRLAVHDFDMQHVSLQIHPNFAARSLQVVEKLSFRTRGASFRYVWLDSDGPQIDAVHDAEGRALQFEQKPQHLVVDLGRELERGKEEALEIRYHVTPHGGLAFVAADLAHPNVATSLWVAGEPNSNHYWLPIYDHPDDKLTADFTVIAPPGEWAVANGRLAGTRQLPDGSAEVHWAQDVPISSYLLTVYISRWNRVKAEWRHDGVTVPVEYDVPPDESSAIAQARFGRTPAMMEYFSALTGVPYPWAKYDEVENPGFFAGLENVSATEFPGDYPTNADRANVEFGAQRGDVGLSHELAHQWFGDLVTCRDWSDLWLNEGFATFMQYVWDEHANGRDRALGDLEASASDYFRSAKFHDRPVVPNSYDSPWDMFGATTYDKGGWAIRVLRGQLGEAAFWKAIHAYLTKYRAQTADTADFEKVLEESTGRDLRAFFQQWFRSPGHPEFKASWHWEGRKKAAVISLVETQARDHGRTLYTGEMKVAAWVKGARIVKTFSIRNAEESFELRLPGRPQMVQIDPEHEWLKELTWEKSGEEWSYEAVHAPYAVDRTAALRALLKQPPQPSPQRNRLLFWRRRSAQAGPLDQQGIVELLADRARHDAAPDTQIFALRQLARLDAQTARPLVEAWWDSSNPALRAAGLEIAEQFPKGSLGESALARLRTLFQTDPIAEARVAALGLLLKLDSAHDSDYLQAALKMHSYDWSVESRALEAWADLGAKALPVLKAWAAPTMPPDPREAAIRGLGKIGKDDPEVLKLLREALAVAPPYGVQMSAASALAALDDQASLKEIEHLRDHAWVGFFRSAFASAAARLERESSGGNGGKGSDTPH